MSGKKKIAAVLAAMACTVATMTATAAEAGTGEAGFTYHPAELRTPDGASRVLDRLHSAARAECRGRVQVLTKQERRCRTEVVDQWITAIGDAKLTRLNRTATRRLAIKD